MKEQEVRDRPAELWIKVLSLVAVITLPLIGVIGTMIISELKELRREVTAFSITFENHEGRISRNEDDIEEINHKLEGKHNGR